MSTILTIIVVVLVASLIIYLIQRYLPVDAQLKNIIVTVLVVLLIIWLVRLIWPYISTL
jgi:hypothetical protein